MPQNSQICINLGGIIINLLDLALIALIRIDRHWALIEKVLYELDRKTSQKVYQRSGMNFPLIRMSGVGRSHQFIRHIL